MKRQVATALVVWLALAAQPLAAQEAQSPDDLIPDEAVADPEGWVEQGQQAELPLLDSRPMPTDMDTPIEADPYITVEQPEDIVLPEIEPLESDDTISFTTFEDVIAPLPEGDEERLSDELVIVFPSDKSLFPERREFLQRFSALSSIEGNDAEDNFARLNAQARADEELLVRMLRAYGYFDSQVIRAVGTFGDDAMDAVRFDIIPGTRFKVGAVDLGDLTQTGSDYEALRGAFGIKSGDLLSLDAIEAERDDLDIALGESGYPFATLAEPELLVDYDRLQGDVTVPVAPNGKYVIGEIVVAQPDFLSARHLQRIARWDPGDIYQRSDHQDLRSALLATGLVGSVSVTPVEVQPPSEDMPGVVDMQVDMIEAPPRTLAANIGYGTEEGIRFEGSWEHRNLLPPEGMVRARAIVGTQEQLLGLTLRKNNFRGRDRILSIDAFASTIDYSAYDARTASLVANYERVSNALFQKPFNWSIGLELVATGEREADVTGTLQDRTTYYIAAIPGYAQIDTSNDLLDPTEGYRLAARVSPEFAANEGTENYYVRAQLDGSYYNQVSDSVVMAGRVRVASIAGAPTSAIAPSRRLYAGGGGSVRGYGYRDIGPLNDVGDPTGGRSLAEFSIEARIRTGLLDGAVGFVPFFDAGAVGDDSTPGLGNMKYGAGIGLRYHTSFGPIRVDLAAPLNPGPNDANFAVYVALGQAF